MYYMVMTTIRVLIRINQKEEQRMNFYEALKNRRSQYDLSNEVNKSKEEVERILTACMTYTPSAFHSQSARVVLLLGKEHLMLWNIVETTLRSIVPVDKFEPTKQKIDSFAKAYGTILYYEDMSVVETLQKEYPLYADNFPIWSLQSAGMLQFSIWTALSQEGLGANLQHYNPLIDEEVRQTFSIPEDWNLMAEMPFGTPLTSPEPLTYLPIEERLFVKGNEQ